MAKGKSKKKLSKKEIKAQKRAEVLTLSEGKKEIKETSTPRQKPIVEIGGTVVVRDFASLLSIPVTELIKVLMKNGILATINEGIDWETAAIVGDELGFEIKLKEETAERPKILPETSKEGKLLPRSPIVTVMGHVDHGKTALLDTIRQTDVVSTESGGITQHIGAYQIEHKGKKITFIDTPGHQAFETMRAHGANITDIVILVVAADEGVKPQTIEAYEHAKKAGVPIIVAINKIDLPTANIERVKKQLSEIGLVCEDLGGQTICVPISAAKNLHIDELLEMILLLAEIKGFKADSEKPASGVVIESRLDPKLGPVASLLIQSGTLKEGDFVVVGETWGRIRLIEDEHKKRLKKAGPSQPVKVAGIKKLPSFGQILQVVPDEKTAKQVLNDLKKAKKVKVKPVSSFVKKEFDIVLKADVDGSLTAIKDNLKKLESEEVVINIVKESLGNVTEDDVMMARASDAEIVGFKVGITQPAKEMIEKEKIKISQYEVIYDLINDLNKIISTLAKKEVETQVGKGQILKIFRSVRKEKIIGLRVSEGKIKKGLMFKTGALAKVGKVTSLQVGKEKVEEVGAGSEAGLGVVTEIELAEGDILEFYKKELV